jgi:hypothetical protein
MPTTGDINPLLRKTDFIAAVLSGSNLSLIEDFRKTLVTSSPPAGEKGPTSSTICVGEIGFFGVVDNMPISFIHLKI